MTQDYRTLVDVLGAQAYDDDGQPLLQTSPSGAHKQLRGDSPLRSTEEPAYTVTSNRADLLPADFEPHPSAGQPDSRYRRLTLTEISRIQTFPDEFVFHGTKTEHLQQLANAVPPLLAQHIARVIRR